MSRSSSVVPVVFGWYDGCTVCCVCLLCFLCLDFCLWCPPFWWDNDYTFCCVGFCVLGVLLFVWCGGCALFYVPLFCIGNDYGLRYVLFCVLGVAYFV